MTTQTKYRKYEGESAYYSMGYRMYSAGFADDNHLRSLGGHGSGGGGGGRSLRSIQGFGPRTQGDESLAKMNGAWKITRNWDNHYIKFYQNFAGRQAEMYKEMGKEFTCEDLALQILIDFASQNELPLKLQSAKGEFFDASDSKYKGNKMSFRNSVLSSFAARDLQVGYNTIGIGLKDVQIGDLMIKANDNQGIGHHTQIVTQIYANFIEITQGNTKFPYRLYNAPNHIFYIGANITTGVFSLPYGNFFNYNTRRSYSNGEINYYQIKSWNFYNFNSGR
ncbi:MAG TPA: hypothetical protein PLE30_11460 [Candidatus Kapabacteria bacterium]|nr:hypothetical protein [Candidatus Kapabacteria bacterium]